MCAILQLVSAPSNPIPVVDHFRRSHPLSISSMYAQIVSYSILLTKIPHGTPKDVGPNFEQSTAK